MSGTVVGGFDELREKLDGIGSAVATKSGRKAVRSAARLIRNAVKAGAPYLDRSTKATERYGHLRDNIKIRLARALTPFTITYKVTTGKAFWALWQEFGNRHQPARPFIRPAVDANTQAAIDIMTVQLGEGIDAAAAGSAIPE
jgi:HK97 gp10 family phage protein